MDELIGLILSLPAEKFEQFLKAKQMLKVDEQRDILRSLLFFKAVENDCLFEELVQFPDPILTYVAKFHEALHQAWSEKTDALLTEDNRLDISVALLKAHFSKNGATLTAFKNKLEMLLGFYTEFTEGTGYLINALTSLMVASSYLIDHFHSNDYNEEVIHTVVSHLLAQQSQSETVTADIEKIHKMIQIYCEQFSKKELKLVGLLHELDNVSQQLRMMEQFIRLHIVASFLGIYSGQISADQFFLMNEQIHNALYVYQDLLLLRVCIYDKGKNAIGRLQLFCSIFNEQDESAVGHDKLDTELKRVKQDIHHHVNKIKRHLDDPVPQSGLVQRLWSYVSTYIPSTPYFYTDPPNTKQSVKNTLLAELKSSATIRSAR